MALQTGEPSWKWRRIIIYTVLVWACYQLFLLIDAQDTRLNETIAWGWQLIVMVLVTGYTGFATAQDIAAIWTTRTARPYSDPPQEPTPPPPADNQTVVLVQPKQTPGGE
ncbi:hypothetical protein NL532_23965 [Mesorhizobium sp. C120A]|uniref:hypothetical protein n=1 Tax=unclassified Mesorhizobium TaxID=325217 RepID=UPI0003D0198B|nr:MULTISPECIES: hypothetical protein [unclassified Mesorhizobium]ESZ60632.1 hypothetical protein X728_14920 [Mesorhizobium sp. L103C120A0]WJI43666.1 hypothetical protein NL532_23965 [Mesorhizobium sp. C120A]